MSRETVAEKARRYLTEGRVIVLTAGKDHVTAAVRGDGHRYFTAYRNGQWICTCPNTSDCTHRRALRLITAPDLAGEGARVTTGRPSRHREDPDSDVVCGEV